MRKGGVDLRYNKIRKFDTANGPGIRSSLFVAGCTHRCKGCFNEAYQSFSSGEEWTDKVRDGFIEHLNAGIVKGVTILGGEPFDQIQDEDLFELLKTIRKETHCDIWIYSGYTLEQILKNEKRRKILEQCDVLVDGPFVETLKDLKLRFRGSSNQRVINIPETLIKGEVVLVEL